MANFHDKIVLNKYLLSLFGIDAIGSKIVSKDGLEVFKELKFSSSEGYTEEGNTKFLAQLKAHLYLTEDITEIMLQQYDENIVRYTHEISEGRDELIVWKYFQYLSLLFTEIYLDKFFGNKKQLQHDLNQFVKLYNNKQIELLGGKKPKKGETIFQVTPFKETDLNKLAFWNATGSGKTLLMHVNIKQYLHYAQKHSKGHDSKILLITPNEPLSRQHLLDFNQSSIPANIFTKNQSGMFSGKEVEIIEVSKLSEESKEKTVAVDSFETHNLVLVDEGHGGMSGDQWKKFRDKLSTTGFAFEYSATFGQAISAAAKGKKDELTQEYSKSILFDYSYKYFYEDGYGKDYRILNLKEDNVDFKNKYLTANLLSFYQQLLIFKNKPELANQFRLFKPLWVFVGSSVNAVRTENKKETSDVLDIVHFLSDFLKNKDEYTKNIGLVLTNKAGLMDSKGYSIFEGSFAYLEELEQTPEQIFEGINREVFHNHNIGANLYLDNLKGASGELGLRVGDTDKYFGVINVGDEKKLHDLALNNGILGVDKDFSESLFGQINLTKPKQEINLLIGSKKFTEGWSSWRVSSMGLMNIGKSEGSQIIQLFGRGVRLQGYEFSLKRSLGLDDYQRPENLKQVRKHLRPLETLQIFGVKANYMERFKELLEEEGLPTNAGDWVTITVPTQNKIDIAASNLKLIQVKETENFKRKEIIPLKLDTDVFKNKQVEVDWYPKIDSLESTKSSKVETTKQIGYLESQHLALIDWTKVYFEIQNFKANKSFPNLEIDVTGLKEIIQSNAWYRIFIPQDKMDFSTFKNINVWQELTTVLLKKYIEQYYLYFKNRFNADHIETRKLLPTDDNLILQYDIRLNKNEEVEEIEKKFIKLKTEFTDSAFQSLQIANQVEAFDHLLHLYKPLIYLGKGYENKIQVFPVALNDAEHQFMKDFETQAEHIKKQKELDEVFLLRNQSKKGIGFFAEGNNFYPDFILWINKGSKQYLTFIDPKGIRNSKGISDPKIQFYKYLLEKVQPQVAAENLVLNSFIISNTKWIEINWKEELTLEDFNKNHVLFMEDQRVDYIYNLIDMIV
ncbi:MAG: DEAD/DEAH box helicase family protein [Flavobacterium sp.]|uniref:DEAD/DEAH box helicase family protein n=2 Tax=Flavobacterium sp. TaxID=239 RepID=UPI0022C382BC|nr:DEAD/DEAH box helicase family protein [Flavobacterium sp.]MCZ8295997.1 DEAD/DEAH box helicase family protein [Flavobacterium sp.]